MEETLWPARLKLQWFDISDEAYKEGLDDEVLPTDAELGNSGAAALIARLYLEASDQVREELTGGCLLFELDNVDRTIIRFRGFEHLIALLRDVVASYKQEFRVLPDDGTCEMDGYSQPDSHGEEHYWKCQNQAVQSVHVSSPSGANPDARMAVCRTHEEWAGY